MKQFEPKIMNVQNVLIADDDFDDIQFLTEAINNYKRSINVSYVTDGEQLIQKLLSGNRADVLILDLRMPCMDGKDCLCQIRDNASLNDLIVIIYTTTCLPEIEEECLSLGANYFVTKPCDIKDIMLFAEFIADGTFDSLK